MNYYVEHVLKNLKKPTTFEDLCSKVLELMNKETTRGVVFLTEDQKQEILDILEDGINNYSIYKTPKGTYIPMSKTSFRIGIFYGNRNGSGNVNVTTSYVNNSSSNTSESDKFNDSLEQ